MLIYLKLGFRKGMVIASLNVNSLPVHKDEVEILFKDQGIFILYCIHTDTVKPALSKPV